MMNLKVKTYLSDNIDRKIKIIPFQKTDQLSIFLKENYTFYDLRLLNHNYILLEVKTEDVRVKPLLKHQDMIEEKFNRKVVFFFKSITRYLRLRLIEEKIAFVIEDGQMYLPFLGLDLDKVKDKEKRSFTQFSTSTQIAFLYFLYHTDAKINATDFAKQFKMKPMTASRALNNLLDLNLLTYEIEGKTKRSKVYQRIDDPMYFEKGSTFLKKPFRKNIYLKNKTTDSYISGIQALADQTLIDYPEHPTYAVYKQNIDLKNYNFYSKANMFDDMQVNEIQLWDYNPELFSHGEIVDAASLYAELKDFNDERVQFELEKLLKRQPWYTG